MKKSLIVIFLTFLLFGMAKMPPTIKAPISDEEFFGRIIDLPEQILGTGVVKILFDVIIPDTNEFKKGAPARLSWYSSDSTVANFDFLKEPFASGDFNYPFEISFETTEGKTELIFDAAIYHCKKDSTLCLFEEVRAKVPVRVTKSGPGIVSVRVEVNQA